MSDFKTFFDVNFITADRAISVNQVVSVSSIGPNGVFFILPYHEPFLTKVCAGYIDVELRDHSVSRFFIVSAFLEVNNNNCCVICEEVCSFTESLSNSLLERKAEMVKLLGCVNSQRFTKIIEQELSDINYILKL